MFMIEFSGGLGEVVTDGKIDLTDSSPLATASAQLE
jgi:hypothetical protein